MRMTVNSTRELVLVDGVPCRVWRGITDRAVKVDVFIARIRVEEGEHAELDAALIETRAPDLSPMQPRPLEPG